MAFVFSFILTSCFVVLFVIGFTAFLSNRDSYNMSFIVNKFLSYFRKQTYHNVFYIITIVFILLCNFPFCTLTAFLVGVVMTYFQKGVWVEYLEEKLINLPMKLRKVVISRLLSEDSTITHWTLHIYIYEILRGEYENFKDMLRLSVMDVKVGIFFMDTEFKSSELLEMLYKLQEKIFKYTKVVRLEEEFANKTDEDYLEMTKRLKRLRDPREKFNFVSRLPWKFSYDNGDVNFFDIAVKHILVVYSFIKTTMVAVFLSISYFLYTIFFFKIQFLKQLSVWFVIGMMYFWLMSGFNFFLKRYQFGKFTSQIQRFWKRTNTYFWLIEGFLLLLFFYYYLNSSQEPLYMYDYSSLNQEYLVSLHSIALNIILISLVVYFMYFTMLRLNSNSWTQTSLYLLVISVFVFFSFFIETYQFYYVISVFNERLWVFNEEENLWLVDIDNPILRTKHQYLLVCLIAKYWHFLFIFLSWVFFLMKSFEKKKVTYVLFGANLQNMIILYALNFACYLQWFKWVYRRFFDLPYTWFFINIDNKFMYRLFSEIGMLTSNLFSLNVAIEPLQLVLYKSLFLWNVDFLCMWKFV